MKELGVARRGKVALATVTIVRLAGVIGVQVKSSNRRSMEHLAGEAAYVDD
jgi:hypothetical protein